MDGETTKLLFANIAPLIQFIGGVYLLFLYDITFSKNPAKAKASEMGELYNDFCNQYQSHILNIDRKDCNPETGFNLLWNKNIGLRFRRISGLSLAYAILILCYIGLESYDLNNNLSSPCRFFACDLIIIIYVCLNLIGKYRDRRWMKPMWWVAFLITCFYVSKFINIIFVNNGLYINLYIQPLWVLIITLLMLSAGVLYLPYSRHVMSKKSKECHNLLSSLKKEVSVIVDISIEKNDTEDNSEKKSLRQTTDNMLANGFKNGLSRRENCDNTISEIITDDFRTLKNIFIE